MAIDYKKKPNPLALKRGESVTLKATITEKKR